MCTTTVPATGAEALAMLESALGMQKCALAFLAAQDAAGLPARPPRTSSGPWNGPTRSEPPSGGGCLRSSIPRTGTWPTGSAPPGPG